MSELKSEAIPASAYTQAGLFVIVSAVALFASAGTIAIPGFWLYVAIYVAVMVASFIALDPGLLRERMRPGGQLPVSRIRAFNAVAADGRP